MENTFIPARAGQYLTNERPTRLHIARSIFAPMLFTKGVQFADMSFYQGLVNWDKYGQHADAVIIRAGQNIWVDSQFKRNWAETKQRGILRGVYWFYDDRANPLTQASLLVSQIKDDLPEMEVFIDYETVYKGPFQGLGNVVKMMLEVERLLPSVKLGIYTGYYFFNEHAEPGYFSYLRDKSLWLAWYTSDPARVMVPKPWEAVDFWQWGTPGWGKDWGGENVSIDMNWFNGTPLEFLARYSPEAPPDPDPPPPGEITIQVIVPPGVKVEIKEQA